jgi:hypothetical protein
MKKKNTLRLLPIVLITGMALVLFAFRPSDNISRNRPGQRSAASLRDLPSANIPDTGGRAVSLDSANACIDRFEAVMKNHGFSDVAGQKVNIHITRTSLITTGEVFSGKGLQEWLNGTAAQYQAAGKTLMVKVQLGIYDSNYLNTYQSDPALRTRNQDRIAIFLIPFDSLQEVQHKMKGNLAHPPPPPPGSGGGTGYDLGGIQP